MMRCCCQKESSRLYDPTSWEDLATIPREEYMGRFKKELGISRMHDEEDGTKKTNGAKKCQCFFEGENITGRISSVRVALAVFSDTR